MKFRFELKQGGCCGAPNRNSQVLYSTNYNLVGTGTQQSFISAITAFVDNYRSQPIEILVTSQELQMLQDGVPATEFAIISNRLTYRKIPITVKD